jgi:hypothetical protein
MIIWGRYQRNDGSWSDVERIDSCTKANRDYLLGEYALAFGPNWKLWTGGKYKDEPK